MQNQITQAIFGVGRLTYHFKNFSAVIQTVVFFQYGLISRKTGLKMFQTIKFLVTNRFVQLTFDLKKVAHVNNLAPK